MNFSARNTTWSTPQRSFKSPAVEPFPLTVIRLVLFGILFVTSVVGNGCVFTAPWRNARLRTFSYCLITCLAVSDFVSTLGLPFALATEQLGSNWIFGKFMCQFVNPMQVVCGMVTTNIHTAISVDRYMSVVYPFKGKPVRSTKWLIFGLICFTAVLCALPAFGARTLIPIALRSGRKINLCIEQYPTFFIQHVYSVFLFAVNYFIPIVIMGILYTRVIVVIRNARHRRRKYTLQDSSCGSASESHHSYTRYEKKFMRMVFFVMVVFVLCYFPYQVFFLLMEFRVATAWGFSYVLFDYIYFVTWLPNAFNPICYGAMDKSYGKAFLTIFAAICKRMRIKLTRKYQESDDDVFV